MEKRNLMATPVARHLASLAATAALVLCVCAQSQSAFAQPRTFSSPAEAAHALAQAVRNHEQPALEAILGGRQVSSSGDESLDKLQREHFTRKYQEMHRLVREPDGTTVLYVGAENWPFPVPLTSTKGRWSFDARAGREEILYRRIGANEAAAIDMCRTAGRTASSEQSRDGYRMRSVSGRAEATKASLDTTRARGSNGKSISGISVVAAPTEYRSTGIMTFIVTQDGRVFERDLGPDTATLASKIDGRVQAAGWKPVN